MSLKLMIVIKFININATIRTNYFFKMAEARKVNQQLISDFVFCN